MSTALTPAMRRSALIAALRDKSLWPEGFEWQFTYCHSCGIGLMTQMLERRKAQATGSEWLNIEISLGLTERQALNIFGRNYNRPDSEVTPAMVADRLESIHRKITQ